MIAGIQEHIEEAGIHSGDSSCVLPAGRIDPEHLETMRGITRAGGKGVVGQRVDDIQLRSRTMRVYVLELIHALRERFRFVSKATGVPNRAYRAWVMAGRKLESLACRKN